MTISRLLLASLTAILPAFAQEDQSWMRLPEATVPLLKSAPQIDGKVETTEWLGAAELGLFAVDANGVDDGLNRRVFIGYDKDRIYLAVRIERPSNALAPVFPAETGRVDSARGGDLFEVAFAPGRTNDNAYAFLLYANGAFGDAKMPSGKEFAWNSAGMQAAGRVTDNGWEGEMSIPFADMGLSGPPKPDEIWAFDAIDNRNTPATLLGHWAFRGGLWKALQNYGTIRFAPAPAARLEVMGQTDTGKIGTVFSVVNQTGKDQTIDATFRLLKRKPGVNGGAKAFLDNIESGMTQSSQAEFTKGVKLPDQIKFALGFFDQIGEEIKQSVTIPDGQQRTLGFNQPAEVGEYLVVYQVMAAGLPLSRGSAVIPLKPPLPLHLEPYWLYSQVVDVVIDDSSRIAPPEGSKTKVRLIRSDAPDKTLAQAELTPAAGTKTYKVPLDVKGIEPGGYQIETTIVGPDNKTLATVLTDLERPQTPPWFRNDYGNKLAVPKPWTPVEAAPNGTVKVWNRVYDLSTFLPKAVVCGGTDVLAAPVSLNVVINGKAETFRVTSLKLTETKPEQAIYSAELSSDHATLKGTVTVGFDGFTWYDVTLAPKGTGLTLDKVDLQAQIKPDYAELFGRHKFLEDPAYPAPVPEKNGNVGIVADALMPFTPLLWIGKEEGGLIFSAEGMQGWSIDRPNAVMETKAPTKTTPAVMEMHIVQKPVAFDKPRTFGFSIQGTPIREAMKDYRNLLIQQNLGVNDDEELIKSVAEAGGRVVVFYYGWRGDPKTEMGGTPERPVLPGAAEKLKKGVELVHKYGMKCIMFTGWGVNAVSPNWQKFGYELGAYPVSNKGWGTYEQAAGLNGGYADFMAYGHADLVKEYGVDGVLYDSATNLSPDTNLRIGNGWTDEEGTVHPTYPIRATREMVRRVYTVYEGEEKPDGFIYNHAGSLWNLNAFANVINRGEGRPMVAPTLRDSWLPLEYRAEYSGEPFGLVMSNEVNDGKKLPMSVSNHLAVTLLHGTFPKWAGKADVTKDKGSYEKYKRPMIQLWRTWQWLPMDGTEKKFLSYRNQTAVVPENKNLYSSAFVSADGKRAIVVVSNFDREPLTAQKVTLDFKALGMAPGPYKVEDAVIGEDVPLTGDSVSLDILDERYRLLRVTAGTP